MIVNQKTADPADGQGKRQGRGGRIQVFFLKKIDFARSRQNKKEKQNGKEAAKKREAAFLEVEKIGQTPAAAQLVEKSGTEEGD